MKLIGQLLRKKNIPAMLRTSDALGVDPMHVEALAFAWLAHRFMIGKPGNLPSVTGARGLRTLILPETAKPDFMHPFAGKPI